MKIFPEVTVRDPNNIPSYASKMIDEILHLLEKRVQQSISASRLDANLYVYIFVDLDRDFSSYVQLKDRLFYGVDESIDSLPEIKQFSDTIGRALTLHLGIPDELVTCGVFLSLVRKKKEPMKDTKENTEDETLQFMPIDPIFSLDEVVMNQNERDAIMRAISLVKERELIYERWNFRNVDKHTKSILCFHGAPGTGKTMAAHGVAKFLGKKILIGSYAQIESEFVGVGAKNLKKFFECAAKEDAVLFIDEADTFLSKRLPSSNDSAKHYNSMSNELYQLVESFDGCIVFASNHIKDFDPAIISRIIEPIEFKLPDFDSRRTIIGKLLQEEFPIEGGKTEKLISDLAEMTDGFSGRDIRKALLICNANAAYKLKIVAGKEERSIVVPVDMIKECFEDVRKAKKALDTAVGKNVRNNILTEFTEKKQKETRYIQMAAHTLLVDGVTASREIALFDELSNVMGVKVLLDRESLPSVEEICADASSKEERMQILDVVTRMAACDGDVPDIEQNFILRVAHLLGIGNQNDQAVVDYALGLSVSYKQMASINAMFGMTDLDILAKMRIEYTEGAAYYHLAEMYKNGSELYGGIRKDENKALEYFNKAKERGFGHGEFKRL